MPATITFTVPAKTTTCFVVATENEPDDTRLSIRRRLSPPFADAAFERLGGSRLAITNYQVLDSPWDLADTASAEDPEVEARVRKATYHIGVTALLPVADQPFGSRLARAVARAIAGAVHGSVVDLNTDRILLNHPQVPEGSKERSRFIMADDWLGAWLPSEEEHCAAANSSVDSCDCVELTTRGLRRFGLPELQISGVSCPHDLAALNVLRATAQRLLPLGRIPGTHSLSPDLPLESDDFATYWGVTDPLWTDGPLPVRLTPRSLRTLSVGPPHSFEGSLNEWLWDELPPVMYDLLGCTPDPLPT
ncbi:hypothetical protein [Spirillospora sp. NPDC047279]|uniref:hypothetical protein n=1 Tax=Spirillospora sp. NPDC047279 TaxID=3155478 RepID=UPI0034076516